MLLSSIEHEHIMMMADAQDKAKSDSPKLSLLHYSPIAVNKSITKATAHSPKNL